MLNFSAKSTIQAGAEIGRLFAKDFCMKAVVNSERVDHFTETIAPIRPAQSRFTVRDGAFLFALFLAVVLLARVVLGH